MSAAAPIPAGPLSALRRSPLRYLWSDPWIASSWLLLIVASMISFGTRPQSPAPLTIVDITGFLGVGYVFWSAYFGLAACWRYGIAGRLWGTVSRWIPGGFLYSVVSMVVFGWILFTFALLYAVYGGGIYHFARRWWLLAHGQQPPFLRRY